jgi:hypothetical protein
VTTNRLAALRCAIEIWSTQANDSTWPPPPAEILRLATELEQWLDRPQDRLILTASNPRPIQ